MSQKTDSLIKLALVFFVSLLSFSIGTYVGKKYSDNQHKLSMLEPAKDGGTGAHATGAAEFAADGEAAEHDTVAGHEKAAGEGDSDILNGSQKPAALTDAEVAQLAEEFATDDSGEAESVTDTTVAGEPVGTIKAEEKTVGHMAAGPTTAKLTTTPGLQVKNAEVPALTAPAAEKPVAKAPKAPAVTPSPAEERVPASIPTTQKEIAPMHFTVQIGSYPTETEASKITQDLQDKGYKTSYVAAKVNGQTWYRVSVGLFGTIKEAQDYKKEFLEKTKLSSAIIQRVQ